MNRTLRHRLNALLLLMLVALAPAWASEYVPPPGAWAHKSPAEQGFDPQALAAAVSYAQDKAVVTPGDMHRVLLDSYVAREPNYRVLGPTRDRVGSAGRSEEHTSELQSLMRISYAVFCLKNKNQQHVSISQ